MDKILPNIISELFDGEMSPLELKSDNGKNVCFYKYDNGDVCREIVNDFYGGFYSHIPRIYCNKHVEEYNKIEHIYCRKCKDVEKGYYRLAIRKVDSGREIDEEDLCLDCKK